MDDFDPVARYFWDADVSSLRWELHRNFIVRRILQYGDLKSLQWLRRQMGDENLRVWIENHQGGGLSPRQIRYLALILNIDSPLADRWVRSASQTVWERRR
jgi:hypothetical protein